jgi:hypothetical protein
MILIKIFRYNWLFPVLLGIFCTAKCFSQAVTVPSTQLPPTSLQTIPDGWANGVGVGVQRMANPLGKGQRIRYGYGSEIFYNRIKVKGRKQFSINADATYRTGNFTMKRYTSPNSVEHYAGTFDLVRFDIGFTQSIGLGKKRNFLLGWGLYAGGLPYVSLVGNGYIFSTLSGTTKIGLPDPYEIIRPIDFGLHLDIQQQIPLYLGECITLGLRAQIESRESNLIGRRGRALNLYISYKFWKNTKKGPIPLKKWH